MPIYIPLYAAFMRASACFDRQARSATALHSTPCGGKKFHYVNHGPYWEKFGAPQAWRSCKVSGVPAAARVAIAGHGNVSDAGRMPAAN